MSTGSSTNPNCGLKRPATTAIAPAVACRSRDTATKAATKKRVPAESEVILDNATVSAGDVYLVLDAPAEGSIVFVQAKRTAEATPGPLSGEDIARLAEGDTQWTAIEGIDAGGCDAEQNAEARGKLGYCGNVFRVTLTQGFYAILGDAPEVKPPMAVLEVRP